MSTPQEVDVIVCGGGSAGCVVAGRLAAADPSLSIAVIETGINNHNVPEVIHPAKYLHHLRPGSTTARFYVGRKSEHLAGRSPIVPVANILGGGSSINFMMYTRASASDFDDWKMEGWSSKDLLPLYQKMETYTIDNADPAVHGYQGPLKVSYGGYRPNIMNECLDVAKERGYEIKDDIQDLATGNAFTKWPKWINPKTGRRSDTAHAYLHTQAGNPNLHILCNSHVSKVLIENGKAVGVQFVPSPKPGGAAPTPSTMKARKMVVVSAGALGSPQILERSGIGAADILQKAGIEVKVDLPGVGTNYQDHNLILPTYRVAPDTDTHDDLLKGVPEVIEKALKDFENGRGKLATNLVDCGGKVRPTQKEIDSMGPAFQKLWDEYFKDAEDKPVMFVAVINAYLGDYSLVPPGKYVTVATYLEYPVSRGFIHVKSADPFDDPDFDPRFNSEEVDLQANVWGYKLGRELVRRMPCFQGEPDILHPKFSASSACKAQELSSPQGSAGRKIQDLVYSDEDHKAVEQWIRENVATTWHSIGTLAMKPREQGGVVDSRLNVYGVEGLKVCDLSICPANVGSNTYSVASLVGEKCAVLIGEDLGIKNI